MINNSELLDVIDKIKFDELKSQSELLDGRFFISSILLQEAVEYLSISDTYPELTENGKKIRILTNEEFENWGRTVDNTPYLTCLPGTKEGIQNIIKYARKKNKTVRVSGYRHTWSDMYSSDKEILISLLPLHQVNNLPDWNPKIDKNNKLKYIKLRQTHPLILVEIGAATTNSHLRSRCINDENGRNYTIPLNVIMSEITFVGSNALICHEVGLQNKTLSDLVYEIEFINANGEKKTVNNPEQLKAAAGCFDLLGIVTAITFKFDRMTYAHMQPERKKLALTIPPPKNSKLPKQISLKDIHKDKLEET